MMIVATLVIAAGIGYSLLDLVGPSLLEFPVPRMRGGEFLPGTTFLADFLKNKFLFGLPTIKRIISTTLGFVFGLILLTILYFISSRMNAKQIYARLLANIFLLIGIIAFPILNTGSGKDCDEDLILANERLGEHLAKVIPANSLVYWEGGLSFTPMVYVPSARIFPPQINDGYTFRKGGDADLLYYFSHWNEELNQQWLENADVIIVEGRRYLNMKDYLNPQIFEEYPSPPFAQSCRSGSELRIFHRLP
jgi:hypothetical protein